MTISDGNGGRLIVRLSGRDYLCLLGICLGLFVAIYGSWLRHDRHLTELGAKQQAMSDRMDRMERTIEARLP